jgi:hypothetical protein
VENVFVWNRDLCEEFWRLAPSNREKLVACLGPRNAALVLIGRTDFSRCQFLIGLNDDTKATLERTIEEVKPVLLRDVDLAEAMAVAAVELIVSMAR